EIEARPLESNILLSAGFIYDNQPFYDVGFRYREQIREYRGIRIEFLGLQRLHEDRIIRLSKNGAIRESLSSDFYSRFGIPVYETIDISLVTNTGDKVYYVDAERMDDEFLERNFPSDSDGNLVRVQGRGVGFTLEEGTTTEAVEHLWNETLWRHDDPAYPELLDAEIDIQEWIKWFAVTAVLGDWDSLLGPHSENHLEYERPSDGRIVVFSNDMDCAWNSARVSIEEGTTKTAIDPRFGNFLRYPPFRRQYYQKITDILDTEFLPDKLYPIIDDLCARSGQTPWVTSKLKEYVSVRTAYLERAIENYIALSDCFRPAIETNDGNGFFTDAASVTVAGSVVPQSAEVRVFKVTASRVELVANGGFEDGTNEWVIEHLVPSISVALDTSVSHNGNASMRVEMLGGNPDYHHTTQIINCEPSTQYKVSYCIMAVGMVSGNMYINIVDADNGEQYLSVDVPQQRDNGPRVYTMSDRDWTQHSAVFTTKEESHRLAVRLARIKVRDQIRDAEGTVWYDNISLQKVRYGYEPLGPCAYDQETGRWSATLPLEPGRNDFAFVARPLESRRYPGMPKRLSVYRSDDTDGDGLPDCWETDWFGSLSLGPHSDPDEDHVTNDIEFLFGLNPCSSDTDGDLIPDSVELNYGLDASSADGASDADGDGLTNLKEYLEYGTNPAKEDTDSDGLTDREEVLVYGTNPGLWDSDGDGQRDSDELYAGNNPLDPLSVFAITVVSTDETGRRLRWTTVPRKHYRVYVSEDMDTWVPLTGKIAANGDSLEIIVTGEAPIERRFYRVRLIQ
ncbi:CotH kinase family protein, partial [bacterium]|nr:CotH kinase family protein [bacterium]